MQAGADVRLADDNGDTSLHHACRGGHIDAARALVRYGADIRARNTDNQAPFDLASPEVSGGGLLHARVCVVLRQQGAGGIVQRALLKGLYVAHIKGWAQACPHAARVHRRPGADPSHLAPRLHAHHAQMLKMLMTAAIEATTPGFSATLIRGALARQQASAVVLGADGLGRSESMSSQYGGHSHSQVPTLSMLPLPQFGVPLAGMSPHGGPNSGRSNASSSTPGHGGHQPGSVAHMGQGHMTASIGIKGPPPPGSLPAGPAGILRTRRNSRSTEDATVEGEPRAAHACAALRYACVACPRATMHKAWAAVGKGDEAHAGAPPVHQFQFHPLRVRP